ncbi:unnamed protein product [Phyllotreta striolata]|uniref:Coiled-coil domain-containing protein 102A n=1 Tax=Phyllotreta striolata TaxID=444603 RepID=A0A9P0GR63_PHYSR|nr:unnamed protein product [Phyllotreta striolata]
MSQNTANRDHDAVSIAGSSRIADASEWEANEALRQRELEEAKGRAAQMEKTMRWWSDCTANWREKWSKVRNERNRAREETKRLRSEFEALLEENALYKREKEELERSNEQLKKDIERVHSMVLKRSGQFETLIEDPEPLKEFVFGHISTVKGTPSSQSNHQECDSTIEHNDSEEYIVRGAVSRSPEATGELEKEEVLRRLAGLQVRLDEAGVNLRDERDEKTDLYETVDRLQAELKEAKEELDELRENREETGREMLLLQERHRKELQELRSMVERDSRDEASSRDGFDRKLADLRTELERLQAENALEWAKRERIETEKSSIERENKKLRSELFDLQERMERRGGGGTASTNSDVEMRHLRQEIADRNVELAELRHAHNKLKKIAQDKSTELQHCGRRAEQYEAEVKKLRDRVEELKRDLAEAEDELDAAGNNARKLQRVNEELREQVDGFQLQLQHLHSRLRNRCSSSLLSRRGTNLEEDTDDEVDDYT